MKKTIILWMVVLFMLATNTLAVETLDELKNPVAYYHFDEPSGSLIDFSGNGNNGTLVGSVFRNQTGIVGNASFDITNTGYFSVPTSDSINFSANNFTASCWLYLGFDNTDVGTHGVFDKSTGSNLGVRLFHAGSLLDWRFKTNETNTDTTGLTWNNAEWYHIVTRYNGTHTSIWWNVTQEAVSSKTTSLVNENTPLLIGVGQSGGSPWRGRLDECVFYDSAISDAGIQNLYDLGVAGQEINLTEAPTPPAGNGNATVDILFTNTTDPTIYKAGFEPGEDFLVWGNWTYNDNNTAINDTIGQCELNLSMAFVEDSAPVEDFTLCGTGCTYSTYTTELYFESTSNIKNDTFYVKGLCNQQIDQGSIIWNITAGSTKLNGVIPTELIPLCTEIQNSTRYIINVSDDFIAEQYINISLTYAGINQRRKFVHEMAIDRLYEPQEINMIYNETNSLWQTSIKHEWYEPDTITADIYCYENASTHNASDSDTITISNVAPRIFFGSMNNTNGIFPITNGTTFDYAMGEWSWTGQVFDINLDIFNVTWAYTNNTIIYNVTDIAGVTELNTPDNDFADLSSYYIRVNANDTLGLSTESTRYFSVSPNSNLTNILLTDGDCNVGEKFQLIGSADCVGTNNCTGNYSFSIDDCSVHTGSQSGDFNIENSTTITRHLNITCSNIGLKSFNFSAENVGDTRLTYTLEKTCTAGGLTTDESSCLLYGNFTNGSKCTLGRLEDETMSIGISIIDVGLLFILTSLLFGSVYGYVKSTILPAKAGFIGLIYFFLTALTFAGSVAANEFLTNTAFLVGFLNIMWKFLMYAAIPIFFIGIVYIVLTIPKINEIKRLMERGFTRDEAERRVLGK